MLDLIALTIGMLAFTAWSAVLMFGGYAYRRRKEQQMQRARIARLIAQHQANRTPAKVESRYPAASDAVRKRAQA